MKYFVYCRKSSESEDKQILSLDSQKSEIERAFAERDGVQIVEVLEEAYSAKTPGRPIFSRMLERIERNEADGIICWHPDRLARNSVDGGRIIYLLDRGVLKDLRFANFSFENNSQGKFMLSIIFGYSKYYVDNLSENVRRGNRTKLEKGWRPNMAPIGYVNDYATKTIFVDQKHGPIVRKVFDLFLTGTYSVKAIAKLAKNEWGYKTPVKGKLGGGPIHFAQIYRILANPFYAGRIVWKGETYLGKHEPLVTVDEFDLVQRLLKRTGKKRPQRHAFTYSGLLKCNHCGRGVTAEKKTNRYGMTYTYYHCVGRSIRVDNRCPQPSTEEKSLDEQVGDWLGRFATQNGTANWILVLIAKKQSKAEREKKVVDALLDSTLRDVKQRLSVLTDLRIRLLIDDEEFLERRQALSEEKTRLEQKRAGILHKQNALADCASIVQFNRDMAKLFTEGNAQVRGLVMRAATSNPTIGDKKFNSEAQKSLWRVRSPFAIYIVRGRCNQVRTFSPAMKKRCEAYVDRLIKLVVSNDLETIQLLQIIKRISELRVATTV